MQAYRIHLTDEMVDKINKKRSKFPRSDRRSSFAYWVREAIGATLRIRKAARHDNPS